MATLIDDTILDALAVVAPIDEVGTRLRDRFDDVVDRIMLNLPAGLPDEAVREVLATAVRGSAAPA